MFGGLFEEPGADAGGGIALAGDGKFAAGDVELIAGGVDEGDGGVDAPARVELIGGGEVE